MLVYYIVVANEINNFNEVEEVDEEEYNSDDCETEEDPLNDYHLESD